MTLAAQLQYMSQDYESMLHLSKEGGDNCERVGILYFGSICRPYQTWAQAWRSNPTDYIDKFKQCLAPYETLKCGLQLGLFHVMLAQLLLAAGRRRSRQRIGNGPCHDCSQWRAVVGAGNLPHARDCALPHRPKGGIGEFSPAIAEAQRTGALMLELRATADLVRTSAGSADADDALQMLATVLAQFTEGLESGDVRAARTLLKGRGYSELPLKSV